MPAMDPNLRWRQASDLLRQGKPRDALRAARRAARILPAHPATHLNLSGFLIDAGSDLHRPRLVREGIALLHRMRSTAPAESLHHLEANLGNAYLLLGQWERGRGPGTRQSLSDAVAHLDRSRIAVPDPRTSTNLAGALSAQGRWIEALDLLGHVIAANTLPHAVHVAHAKRGAYAPSRSTAHATPGRAWRLSPASRSSGSRISSGIVTCR